MRPDGVSVEMGVGVGVSVGGGILQSFTSGGFGRAIEMGAGFGIGNSLINSIFGNL